MATGTVNFSGAGQTHTPSPSIWGDCPKSLLVENGLGYYFHEEFLGGGISSDQLPASALGTSPLGFIDVGTSVSTFKAAERGGYLSLATGATDNNGYTLFTEPMARITRNSGQKAWFEIRLEIAALGDAAMFVGFGEEACQVAGLVADNPSTSAQADLIGESLFGFVTKATASAIAAWDAVYKKDAGTAVTVLASAGTAVAATEIKLGMRFDGYEKLHFYVNGVKVATAEVDSTMDQAKDMCVVIGAKAGTGTAITPIYDWVRAAFQERD